MGQALQNYEQRHNLHALQVATGSCQVRFETGWRGFREDGAPDPAGGTPADGRATQHWLRLVAHRQRCRPRLCGGKSLLCMG